MEAIKYPVAPARRAAAAEQATARKSPRVAGTAAGPGVGDSVGWMEAAGTGGGSGATAETAAVAAAAAAAIADAAAAVAAAAATVVQGASVLESWLLEQVVSGAMDDMGAYIRDAVEEQAEEEAWLDGVAPGRPDTRRAGWGGGGGGEAGGGDDGGPDDTGAEGSDDDSGPGGWYIPDNPRRLANWLAETALWEIVGDLTEEVATEAGREAEGGV